jgi:hypothetical protein
MQQNANRSIREKLADRELIQNALKRAAREAVLSHARAGNPVAVWRDGKVVWIPPEEILAEYSQPTP